MDDWLDSANDGLEDNAGVLGAMGGLAALNNQKASIAKLSAIQEELKKAQAASAKTEKERLAVEKRRLALEQAQKEAAEAVKELRVLMADADTLLERISQMADAPFSGGGSYDLDLTSTAALIQVKLELVEKNSAMLSDLADLKEQRRLKTQFEIKLSEFVALKRLPENPLSFVEEEVFDQLQHIWSAFVPVEQLSNERALKGEGGLKALDSTGYIISEASLLSLKERLTEALQKLDQLEIQLGVTSRFTIDHLEELEILWGQYCFLKGKQPNFNFSSAVDYLKRATEEPEFKSKIEHSGSSVLATIESHLTCARDQGVTLREAIDGIRLGDYEAAHSAQRVPKAERYEKPLFIEIQKSLAKLDTYEDCFRPSIDSSAEDLPSLSRRIETAWDILGVESWADDSDLKQRISKNKNTIQAIISKRARKFRISLIGVLFILMGIVTGHVIIEEREKAAAEAVRLAKIEAAEVVAWGSKTSNQCDVPSGLTDVVGISAGTYHNLALKKDGKVVAWGSNRNNQCDVPSGLTDVVGISAFRHSLALKKDGTVVAWGSNRNNQCDVPSGLTDIVGISAGVYHSLAIRRDGTVVAWGGNAYNQCDVPSGLTDVVGVAGGGLHSLALKNDGTVFAWGSNIHNQCGVASSLTDVVGISAGAYHSLAVKKDGTVVAWGSNSDNQCDVPGGLTDVVGISAGLHHSLALKKDGTVVAWGGNSFNQCDVPSGLTDVVGIVAGNLHSLALKKAKQN